MFAIKSNQITITTMAHYSYNNGTLNIYYDKPDEFSASLDILLDHTSEKFCSLSFSFHNKTSDTNTILMSIVKKSDDMVNFHLSNNVGNSFVIQMSRADLILSEIASRCVDVLHERQKSAPYYDNQMLISQTKQLLTKFIMLGKGALEMSDKNKIPEIFPKISHILSLEVEEFKSVIEVNEISSPRRACK